MKNLVTFVLMIVSIAGIAYCFNFFKEGDLTTNEQVLFSILLTIVSFLLSWVLSHFYYENSHKQTIEDIKKENQSNLKIYATKAAEKVKNLSAQLVGLVTYLNEELAADDYSSAEENLRAKEERIYSAVHIIKTLKSINDGSLSDWSGVIPEAIAEIAEAERETFEEINRLVSDFSEVKTQYDEDTFQFPLEPQEESLKIEALSKKIDLLLNSVTGVSSKIHITPSGKVAADRICPHCNRQIHYRQKPLATSRKSFKCPECKNRILSTWSSESGFALEKDSRTIGKDRSKISSGSLDEDFLLLVQEALPPQPWPKQVTQHVASQLSVSTAQVKKAINMLIKRGVFKHQVNGVLYVPALSQSVAEDKT